MQEKWKFKSERKMTKKT